MQTVPLNMLQHQVSVLTLAAAPLRLFRCDGTSLVFASEHRRKRFTRVGTFADLNRREATSFSNIT
jgi:hypothetical protein